jgi:tellurite resistance protein
MSREAEARLMSLLTKIFADNVVTAEERSALLEFRADRHLDALAVQKVFKSFVQKKWGEALADGIVSEEEKLALQRVIEELELPDSALPTRLRLVLRY